MHEDLSATRLMTHLNGMISTVNQAIAELEMPEQAPSKKVPRAKRSWLREIVIGVVIGLILLAIGLALKYFGIEAS
jgi:hypothetical protein